MLKIVAGKIIWQSIRSSGVVGDIRKRLEIFWAQDSIDFSKDFPMEPGSQWDGGFAQFVTRLEEDLDDPDIGLFPIAFNAYQVRLGESEPQAFGRGAVSISIGELFSIYIPPNSDGSCEWIDLKITNITKIEPINEAVPGDLKGQLRYLKLHLSDSSNNGYLYLISMRPSSKFDRIMVSCYAEEADDIVENVERCRGLMLSSKQGDAPHISAVSGMLVNPEISQSQKEKEEELQKRRGYVLDAVNSPAGAEATPSGQSESGEILSINTPDLQNNYDVASSPIIRRSSQVGSPVGTTSIEVPRLSSTETRPKEIQEATFDSSLLSSPPDSAADIVSSREDHSSDPREHSNVQSRFFRNRERNPVENTRSPGPGENKPNKANEEPTDGLLSVLQRIPSLIPLEEIKKRGKLKDRLANERGEIPTPPSPQKRNTGRKRATAKQPVESARPAKTTKSVSRKAKDAGTTKSIKPVTQRKKPEPLPISDDIWELPLSSPVSQEARSGTKAQKRTAGINQKTKPVPKPTETVKGQLTAGGKVVPVKRGRGKGRSYKSKAYVTNSSGEESTPYSGSEPLEPAVPRTPEGKGTEKAAPILQPKALTKTVQTTKPSGAQTNLRRSLRERKPPKFAPIPPFVEESEGEEQAEYSPRETPTGLLSPEKIQKPVKGNKRALPEAYKIDPPIKKRKDVPVPPSIDAPEASDTGRKVVPNKASVAQQGKNQKDTREPRVVKEKTSPVAPEHVRDDKTTAMSSKRKAGKPSVTPKEPVRSSHKRQRTSPPKAIGNGKRGGSRAFTLDASDSPETTIFLSQIDGPPKSRDSSHEGPDLDRRVTDNDDAHMPLDKREYVKNKGNIEEGRTSNIISLPGSPEPISHLPQTAQKVPKDLDDASKKAPTHDRESQKHGHSSLEHFPRPLLSPETMDYLGKTLSNADIPGESGPSRSPTTLHSPQMNLEKKATATSVHVPRELAPHVTSNLVDASTSTADLSEISIMSTSRSRTSSPPPPQLAGENCFTIQKQMPSVTSPMVHLKGKVTASRAVSANAVSKAAINEPTLLSPIKFSKNNSFTGPTNLSATSDEELSIPNDRVNLSTTQRLQSLLILSEGDEDIVVWEPKEKKEVFTTLQRTETGHTEVDENGSPSKPDAPKPSTRPKKISWEILNQSKEPVSESSQKSETEKNMFANNSPKILGGRGASLGRQLFAEQTYLVGTRAKGGKPKNPKISTGDEGGRGHFKYKDRETRHIGEPKNGSTELPKPFEKLRETIKDVISISSTSPSPALPLSLLLRKPDRIYQASEPSEDSDDAESMELATAKVLRIIANRGTSIPKPSPPVLRYPKPKGQSIRNRMRKPEENNNLAQGRRVEVANTEEGPSEDTTLIKKGHSEIHFSKMLQKRRFVKIERPLYHENLPNQQLTEEHSMGASRVFPMKGGRARKQERIEDSNHDELDGDTEIEDSTSVYTDENGPGINPDTDSDSGSSESSNSEDEGEDSQEEEEDAHIIWRKSLPGHLKETLSALEQITRGLVKYLMCSEELAIEMIEDFEARGNKLIQALDDSHTQEYEEFLENLEEAKKAIAAKAEELDQVIRNGLDSIERKEEEWRNSQMDGGGEHQKLDDEIEKMLMDTDV
ncbi:hypothetical protein L873DRAFT_1837774 [Choiromyces venosus 120613-1]|uniref:Uncharacterized protein n=1 Tax=Choiromyces venosus 120613-1 TaxID=1336337 RepID=A0A3N4JJ88_9PEZI|nr:hypothetical protein L873DRAFT_1837774 [Choiromyces venosus 120613-1]